eukprot:g71.t1
MQEVRTEDWKLPKEEQRSKHTSTTDDGGNADDSEDDDGFGGAPIQLDEAGDAPIAPEERSGRDPGVPSAKPLLQAASNPHSRAPKEAGRLQLDIDFNPADLKQGVGAQRGPARVPRGAGAGRSGEQQVLRSRLEQAAAAQSMAHRAAAAHDMSSMPSAASSGTSAQRAVTAAADVADESEFYGQIRAPEMTTREIAARLQDEKTDLADLIARSRPVKRVTNNERAMVITGRVEKKKHEQWTYQLLTQSPALAKFIGQMLAKCREAIVDFDLEQGPGAAAHKFQWVCLVDNSGSMSTRRHWTAEALVVFVEVLRKLECEFAVATFGGGPSSQNILKPFEEPCTYRVGERILSGLTFNEGSSLATGIEVVARTLFDTPEQVLNDTQKATVHRIMVVITDGLSQEIAGNDAGHLVKVCKDAEEKFDLNVSVLQMGDAAKDTDGGDAIKTLLEAACGKDAVRTLRTKDDQRYLAAELGGLCVDMIEKTLEDAKGSESDIETAWEKHWACCPKLGASLTNLQCYQYFDKPEKHFAMDLQQLLEQHQGAKPKQMYRVSQKGRPLPFAQQFAKQLTARRTNPHTRNRDAEEEAFFRQGVFEQLQHYASQVQNPIYQFDLNNAQRAWATVAQYLRQKYVDKLVEVFEDLVLPINKHTRRKADAHGSQLHLPGLIKAVITDFSYKKIFSTRTGGGKRIYSVSIALDVSMSMQGLLSQNAVETLVALVTVLQDLNIDAFSVVLFGEVTMVIKREDQPWDPRAIFALLTNLRFQDCRSDDAHGVLAAKLLLEQGTGEKKMFVITDGYGTSGLELTRQLEDAESEGIDVVAIAVGQDKSNVARTYANWIECLLPRDLPKAFRALYAADSEETAEADEDDDDGAPPPGMGDGEAGKGRAIMDNLWDRRDQDLTFMDELKREREVKLTAGSGNSNLDLDIAFVVDCTGSMAPILPAVKAQLKAILGTEAGAAKPGLVEQLKEKFEVDFPVRAAFLGYRDFGDAEQFVEHRFDTVPAVWNSIERATALGGGDLAEDVLGALDRVASWDDWNSKLKFIVWIADAPGHGRELHRFSGKDRFYDASHPRGLEAESVMHHLASRDVSVLFCTANPDATSQMVNSETHPDGDHMPKGTGVLQRYFHDEQENAKGRLLRCLNLCSSTDGSSNSFESRRKNHFVFVLDDSGSMGGDRWDNLMLAYQRFLEKRDIDQGVDDEVSVILFSSDAVVRQQRERIDTVERADLRPR